MTADPRSELVQWSRLFRRFVAFILGIGAAVLFNLAFAQTPSEDDALRGGGSAIAGKAMTATVGSLSSWIFSGKKDDEDEQEV